MSAALRWARRFCFATSAACLAAAAMPAGGAHADTTGQGRPPIYTGYAAAAGIHQRADKIGGVAATSEPLYSGFPEALALLGYDVTNARASTYDPGATIRGLGGIACNQIPGVNQIPGLCPTPNYPLSATAPTTDGQPDAKTEGTQTIGSGTPFAVTTTSAIAHAGRDYALGDAVNADSAQGTSASASAATAVLSFRRAVALALHGPAAAAAVQPAAADGSSMRTGHMRATSKVAFPDPANPGMLVATATAIVDGVDFLGGQVHINSVTTTSTYRTDGRAPPVHDNNVTISGVTAGGQPAVIDNDGVHLVGAGQGKPALDAANNALQQLFKATQTGVRLVNASAPSNPDGPPPALTSESFSSECLHGEADGVQFFQQADASRVPNGGVFYLNSTIGGACTDASVDLNGSSLTPPPGDSSPPAVGETSPGTPPGEASLPAAPANASTGTPSAPASVRRTTGVRPRGARAAPFAGLEASFGPHVDDRLAWLYLALAFAMLGLCLMSRFFTAPRLPRHR